jgi:hypothetical protein
MREQALLFAHMDAQTGAIPTECLWAIEQVAVGTSH